MEAFERHAAAITNLDEEYLMNNFLNGLKEEIEAELRLYEPHSLTIMMKKARLIKEENRAFGKGVGYGVNS